MNSNQDVFEKIGDYYSEKLHLHGPTAKGVDWKNEETQDLRFDLLSRVFDGFDKYSVNDLGCGYGAFAAYLIETDKPFAGYYGYDISADMIEQCQKSNGGLKNCHFIHGANPERREFTVASGIFNVKLDTSEQKWQEAVIQMLEALHNGSSIGFAFNMLNLPTDESFRRDHLFYADPIYYQDLCRKQFGYDTTILTDKRLFEFTVLVKDLHSQS